jgi:hypothetical protein
MPYLGRPRRTVRDYPIPCSCPHGFTSYLYRFLATAQQLHNHSSSMTVDHFGSSAQHASRRFVVCSVVVWCVHLRLALVVLRSGVRFRLSNSWSCIAHPHRPALLFCPFIRMCVRVIIDGEDALIRSGPCRRDAGLHSCCTRLCFVCMYEILCAHAC